MKKVFVFVFVFAVLVFGSSGVFAKGKHEHIKKFKTPAGMFKVLVSFSQGIRGEFIITPSGKFISGFPICWPDGKCEKGDFIEATETVVDFTSHKGIVYLLTGHSVWRWNEDLDKFEFILRSQFIVAKKHKTKAGDVFTLFPGNGAAEFYGLLYISPAGDIIEARTSGVALPSADKVVFEKGRFKIKAGKEIVFYDHERSTFLTKEGAEIETLKGRLVPALQ